MSTWWVWLLVCIASIIIGAILLAAHDISTNGATSNAPKWARTLGVILLLIVICSAMATLVTGVKACNRKIDSDAKKEKVEEKRLYELNWQFARDAGLLGQIPVVQVQPAITGVSGSIHGSSTFFLMSGGGSINGEVSSESYVQFWWKAVNGDIIPSQLPQSIFKLRIDNALTTPTVQLRWLPSTHFDKRVANGTANYNDYIDNINIDQAIIRMNQSDFDRGVFMRTTKSSTGEVLDE